MLPYHSVSPVRQQFRRNNAQKILATQVQLDLHRFAAHLQYGGILPVPTNDLNNTWALIPNQKADFAPWSLRKDTTFVPAPPPTPVATSGGCSTSGVPDLVIHRASSSSGNSTVLDSDDELYVIPVPQLVAPMITSSDLDGSATFLDSEFLESSSVQDEIFHPSPRRLDIAEFSGFTAPSPSLSTCTSPSICESQTSALLPDDAILNSDTQQMVNEGIDTFMWQGPKALVKVLLDHGVEDFRSASLVAAVAQTILKRLRMKSRDKSKDLGNALRFGAMSMFRNHWKLNGQWKNDLQASPLDHSYLTLKGVNMAGFLGSLFSGNIVTGEDLHLCLDLLIDSPVHFDRLCAMHALIAQANDKLCKAKFSPSTTLFREKLSVQSPETGHFLWGHDSASRLLVADILSIIDRWFATQTLKRARANAYVDTGSPRPETKGAKRVACKRPRISEIPSYPKITN